MHHPPSKNPTPFIASSAPDATDPTSSTSFARRIPTRQSADDVAVLAYWDAVRNGRAPAPRPGEEARVNKRRCGHLDSHIADVLAPGTGTTTRRQGGHHALDEEDWRCDWGDDGADAQRVKREQVGEALDADEVLRIKTMRPGTRVVDAYAEEPRDGVGGYSMPFAPEEEQEAAYEEEEDAAAGEFFEYGKDPLPRHMEEWYEPPNEEYGSFVGDLAGMTRAEPPAAGQYNWNSEERRYATARNLKSHALW